MRLCFISRRFFPAVSGMSVYAANLLRELVGAGHGVTMVSQYRGDAFGRGVYGGGPPPAVPGVRVIGREAQGEQDDGAFERDIDDLVATVTAEHARQPFALLHAQYGYPTGWAALLAARRLGLPSVVSIQGGDGHWVGSCCEHHRLAMVRVLDHAGAAIIGCASFAAEVCERLGTDPGRLTVIPGAVEVLRFTPRPGWRSGEVRDPPRILYHGRIDRRKGILDLILALAPLHDSGHAFRLVVSGIGPDVEPARELLAATGLAAVTDWLGPIDYDAVPAVYGQGDIFASPTYAEGFSNTILEAMAAGLPIVAGRAVGVVDCLRDGENGLLVDPGDIAALRTALVRLLDDAPLRQRLATAALAECRRLYSWTAVGQQIMGVYERLAGTAPDQDWPTDLPPDDPAAPCRFRATPHLL